MHSILGLLALVLCVIAGLTGLLTSAMIHFWNRDRPWSDRDQVYTVAKVHRYSSYLMVLLGNVVCSGGIITYFNKIGYGQYGLIGITSCVLFVFIVAFHECCLRRLRRQEYKLI